MNLLQKMLKLMDEYENEENRNESYREDDETVTENAEERESSAASFSSGKNAELFVKMLREYICKSDETEEVKEKWFQLLEEAELVNEDNDLYEDEDSENDEACEHTGRKSVAETIEYINDGVDRGADIGETVLGIPGMLVGAVIGGAVGCVREVLEEVFG